MTQHDDIAPAASEAGAPDAEQRQWAFIAHLSALAGLVIPFGNLIGPLVVWQIKKDTMPFVADQAKEALNFQITVSIAMLVSIMLFVVLIGMLLLPLLVLAALVLTLVAAVKANNGEMYRYPFTWRLIT